MTRVLALLLGLGSAAWGETLKPVLAIDLPGKPGRRFEGLAIDTTRHWLLAAHSGAGLLYAIDLRTHKLVETVADLPEIQGVAYLPELDRIFVSLWGGRWGDERVVALDAKSMKVLKTVKAPGRPGGLAWAAPFHKLYVSNERGRSVTALDARTYWKVKTVDLGGEAGVPRYDPAARRVYVNVQELGMLAVIDPLNDAIVGLHPLGRCKVNHGMALDVKGRRAFITCEGNDSLAVFDLDEKRTVAFLPVERGPDAVEFDPVLKRVYVACFGGAISVILQDDPDHYRKLEDYPVQRTVHSILLDPETRRLYAPEHEEDGKPVSKIVVYEPVLEAAGGR